MSRRRWNRAPCSKPKQNKLHSNAVRPCCPKLVLVPTSVSTIAVELARCRHVHYETPSSRARTVRPRGWWSMTNGSSRQRDHSKPDISVWARSGACPPSSRTRALLLLLVPRCPGCPSRSNKWPRISSEACSGNKFQKAWNQSWICLLAWTYVCGFARFFHDSLEQSAKWLIDSGTEWKFGSFIDHLLACWFLHSVCLLNKNSNAIQTRCKWITNAKRIQYKSSLNEIQAKCHSMQIQFKYKWQAYTKQTQHACNAHTKTQTLKIQYKSKNGTLQRKCKNYTHTKQMPYKHDSVRNAKHMQSKHETQTVQIQYN